MNDRDPYDKIVNDDVYDDLFASDGDYNSKFEGF